MLRRLFTVLSVLSLVLCLATLALWALSYRWGMEASGTWDYYSATGLRYGTSPEYQRYHRLGVSAGRAYVQWLQSTPADPRRPIQKIVAGYPLSFPLHPSVGGFSLARSHSDYPTADSYYELAWPLWLPAVLFAILPARRFLLRKRFHEGLCAHCGYNLAGNISGVCPECGMPVPQDAIA